MHFQFKKHYYIVISILIQREQYSTSHGNHSLRYRLALSTNRETVFIFHITANIYITGCTVIKGTTHHKISLSLFNVVIPTAMIGYIELLMGLCELNTDVMVILVFRFFKFLYYVSNMIQFLYISGCWKYLRGKNGMLLFRMANCFVLRTKYAELNLCNEVGYKIIGARGAAG